MRFLLVVPPLAGHVAPLRGVAKELAASGHDVAWCGPQPATSSLTGTAAMFRAGDSGEFALQRRPSHLRGFAALKFLWEDYLIPLADAMVSGVEAAVAAFLPDVIVTDQQAFAGALVATRRGLPWATSASTSTELANPLGALPKIAGWIDGLQGGLCARHGVSHGDLRFSPHLVLAFTTEALAGTPGGQLPVPPRYVGPAVTSVSTVDFPWPALDDRPLVVVTLGTANVEAGKRFLAESAIALAGMPDVQGLVVDPSGKLASDKLVNDKVLLARRIPQAQVLRRAAAVVCHGGHNTVCEALGEGVPLVVAPIRDDQSMLAAQVVAAGAGVRLRFDRATAPDLHAAIATVLASPSYAAGAARIRDSFAAAGGAPAAARHLETLTRHSTPASKQRGPRHATGS
jgi:UDP:flavonoid glycosyltransferase YjiC (YdhE family)